MSPLSIAFAVLLGCGLAYRFGRLTGSGSAWAQVSLVIGPAFAEANSFPVERDFGNGVVVVRKEAR